MRIFLVLILLGMFSFTHAQDGLFRGFIKSSEDFDPLFSVRIKDVQTGKLVASDSSGYFEIKTKVGHTLELSRMGIKTQNIVVKQQMFAAIQQIVLRAVVQELPEHIVKEQTQYQIDSTERVERYKIPLSHEEEKAEWIITPIGIGVTNPISSWMQHIAPKTKQKLKFQKNFSQWEQEKYIAQKYNEERVIKLTGLTKDSLAWFINAYPMPYLMARESTDPEIDYWIKANFDDWKTNAAAIIRKMEIKN